MYPNTSLASSTLHKDVEKYIFSELIKIHPTGNINIAFNLPKTQKKYLTCKNFHLPAIKKVPSGGRTSLRLTCNQPNWSTYISLKISISYLVATAKMHINKGEQITFDKIYFSATDVTKIHRGYFTDPAQIITKEAARTIKKSQTFTPQMLKSPMMIYKGDTVFIQANTQGLSISTLGTALQDGREGKQIRVKNNRSGKTLKAYVFARGKVTINANN